MKKEQSYNKQRPMRKNIIFAREFLGHSYERKDHKDNVARCQTGC